MHSIITSCSMLYNTFKISHFSIPPSQSHRVKESAGSYLIYHRRAAWFIVFKLQFKEYKRKLLSDVEERS